MIGVGENRINPTGQITRGEIATVMLRVVTDDTRATHWTRDNPFHDVPNNGGTWHANAISTTYAAGLISGLPDGGFAPNRSITRAEIATVISRFIDRDQMEGLSADSADFIDVSSDHWAYDAINLVAELGWMVGQGGRRFNPDAPATRAEFATLMNRVLGRTSEQVDTSHMIVWADNHPADWYYWAMQVASNHGPDVPARNWGALQLPDAEPHHVFGAP
jgi:hypothetical protein